MTTQTRITWLLKWTGIAIFAQYALTSIHHVYGGLVYGTPDRLSMPIYGGVALLITLGLLFLYQRTRSGVTLALFSTVTALLWIVTDLVDSLYAHTIKDILFLVGVPAAVVQTVHPPVVPQDFVYTPNDVLFEITGVLKLVIIYALVILLYRLIREHQRSRPSSLQLPAVPLATTVVAILGTVAFIVGGSLLLAYIATARMAVLIPSLLVNGLGVLALAAAITSFIRKPHTPASENKAG